jgi:outer membrane receptor for ferric coprogen and ferric-rhodotorulic acid
LTYARSELDGLSYYHGGTGAINPVTGLGSSIAPSRWQGVEDRYTLDTNASGPFTLFGRKHELVAGVNVSASDEHVPLYGGLGGAGVGGWLWSWNSTYVGTLGNVWDWNGHGLPKPDFSQNGVTKRKENQQSAYLTSRFNLTDKANLILGARVMNWERTADTTTVAGSFTRTEEKERGVVIPYAGLVYAVNDTWSLYGSYTKIFNPQAPNIRDISDNPLAPEVGTAYELGVKAGFFEERLNANLALFKIQQDKVAEQTNIMGVYRLREGVTTEGVELEVNGALTDGWNIAGGYTFSYSKNKDGSRAMHRIPQHTVKTFTTYKPGGSWDKLTIGGGVNWKGRNGWEGGQYAFQEGYAVASAMARYEFSKQLSLTVNINNLFDKKYYDALLDNGMYGEPRSVMASLKYKF